MGWEFTWPFKLPCDLLANVDLPMTESNLAGANDFLRSVAVGSKDGAPRPSVSCLGVTELLSTGGRRDEEERAILVVRLFSSPDFPGRNAGEATASCFPLFNHII